jgi:STE24 endopeptidase
MPNRKIPFWRTCLFVTKTVPVGTVLAGTILAVAILIGVTTSASAQESAAAGGSQPSTVAMTSEKPYHLPPDKLAQAKALGHIRTAIHFGAELWQLAVLVLLLATCSASRLGQWAAAKTPKGWLQACLFSAALVVFLFFAAELPVEAIGHFFSLRYGISIELWPAWLSDEAKTLALEILLETPAFMLLYGLMHWSWSRRCYWIWAWVITVPVMVAGVFLMPELIEPLFNKFEPLSQSHPELVRELQKVVARTGTSIPPERMFLMKASEKSTGLNAYVTGLGASKRIVVWDTTADRMPTDEILFTFAHESGHYVLNHIPKGMTLAVFGLFALFGLAAWLSEWTVRRWGRAWCLASITSLPGLAVLLLTFSLLQDVTEPITNFGSRYIEHEADIYGQEAVHGIVPDPQKTAVAAFNHLGAAYLDDPDLNPFVEFWQYDHPSIQRRARFAAQYDPWVEGQKPRFFPR